MIKEKEIVVLLTVFFEKLPGIINYLITESEVITGKSQTEALPY